MNTRHPALVFATAVSAVALALTLHTPAAEACGGFFCSAQAPVNQVAERILFTVEGNRIEAHIQIQYAGPSENFSWVLPLVAEPEIGVGTDRLFTTLHAQTDPRFQVKWNNPDGCNYQSNCDCFLEDSVDADGPSDPNAGGGVSILKEGSVGPYAFKVVQAGDGGELFDWLNDNGYDQPAESKPLIEHYAGQQFVFLALQLEKDKDVGDIQPIVLSWEGETAACIPLRLTSIAAAPDMPIYSWVLSSSRAVPLNFFHVVLNAKAFDWLNCAQGADNFGCGFFGPNQQCQQAYMDQVTAAANSANGRGFVTEYAGQSAIMNEMLYREGQYDLEKLAGLSNPADYLSELLNQGFPRDSMMQQLIRDAIPKPDESELPDNCKSDNQFYATWNIAECIKYMPEGWAFDAPGFTEDIEDRVVMPLINAQRLFDTFPYMTRLFTTISPDEMTKDPIFSFNPDLPDVSNVHTVEAKATCVADKPWVAEKIELTYADGTTLELEGNFESCGQLPGPPEGLPPAVEVQVIGESGPPAKVAPGDLTETEKLLDQKFPANNAGSRPPARGRNDNPIPNTGTFGVPARPATPAAQPGSFAASGGSGCAGGSTSAPLWLALAALIGVAWRRRRVLEA